MSAPDDAPTKTGSVGWVGLAAAAVVLLAGLFFLDNGGSDDGATEPDSAAETGASSTTTPPQSTPASAAADANADDAAAESAEGTTTTIDPTPLVVEDAAIGVDDELVAIAVNGSLYGVSLNDGRWTQGVELEARPRDIVQPIIVVGDGVVLRRSPDELVLLQPPLAPAWDAPWSTKGDVTVPADSPDRFGTLVVPSIFEPRIARIFTTDGEQIAEAELPPSAELHGVVGDDLLLGFGGKTVRFDPETATSTVIADGRPLSFDGEFLMWESCDDSLGCSAVSGPVDDPDRTEWSLLTPSIVLPGRVPLRLTDIDPTGNAAISLGKAVTTDRGRITYQGPSGSSVRIVPFDVFLTTAHVVSGGEWVAFHTFRTEDVLLWNPATDEIRTVTFPRTLMGFAVRH